MSINLQAQSQICHGCDPSYLGYLYHGYNLGVGVDATHAPTSRLHVNNFTGNTFIQVTNLSTGFPSSASSLKGLFIGMENFDARFKLVEDAGMIFSTNATDWVKIENNGNTGIGLMNPNYRLHVHDDAMINPDNTGNGTQSGEKDMSPYAFSAIQLTNSSSGEQEKDGILLYQRDLNAGINLQENADLRFHTNSAVRFTIFANGKAGFNTTAQQAQLNLLANNTNGFFIQSLGKPQYALFIRNQSSSTEFIRGYINDTQNLLINGEGETQLMSGVHRISFGEATSVINEYATSYLGFNTTKTNNGYEVLSDGYSNGGFVIWHGIGGSLCFSPLSKTATNGNLSQIISDEDIIKNTALYIGFNGNVGVGTRDPGNYKLAVEGSIAARRVRVTELSFWSDFVFEPDYELMSLNELDAYIQQNGHLPGVPSSEEVEENGIDLAEMNAILLQKIEELTLYIIELEKKINEDE